MVNRVFIKPEDEAACGKCPYQQTGEFIEAAYRAGHASWEKLEHYTDCLKQYQRVSLQCNDDWVKFTLAELARIPHHHRPVEIRGENNG